MADPVRDARGELRIGPRQAPSPRAASGLEPANAAAQTRLRSFAAASRARNPGTSQPATGGRFALPARQTRDALMPRRHRTPPCRIAQADRERAAARAALIARLTGRADAARGPHRQRDGPHPR